MIINFIRSKIFLCSLSFVTGLAMGYILGIINFGLSTASIFWSNLKNSLAIFSDFTPSPTFLSDVAAFEAVVIAIAIPLSFEIISRISERYKSEVITRRFTQEWVNKWLPIFLIGNVIGVITLRFFVDDNPNSWLWKILAWITFAGFLFVAGVLVVFFVQLKKYITNSEFVLKRLFDEAENSIKK